MSMTTWKPFSRRMKEAQRKPVKFFEYEAFPEEFRIRLDYAPSEALKPLVTYSYTGGIDHDPVWDLRHFLAEQHARYEFWA